MNQPVYFARISSIFLSRWPRVRNIFTTNEFAYRVKFILMALYNCYVLNRDSVLWIKRLDWKRVLNVLNTIFVRSSTVQWFCTEKTSLVIFCYSLIPIYFFWGKSSLWILEYLYTAKYDLFFQLLFLKHFVICDENLVYKNQKLFYTRVTWLN